MMSTAEINKPSKLLHTSSLAKPPANNITKEVGTLEPRPSNEGGSFSLPVPPHRNFTPGIFPSKPPKRQLQVVKKKRRRRLSEILRLEGLHIGEPMKDDGAASVGKSDEGTSLYSWNRYTLPGMFDRTQSRSSIFLSDTSILSNADLPAKHPTITGLSAAVKFRQMVHKIMNQIFWSKKYQGIEQHQKTTYLGPGERGGAGERELLTFNARYFRPDVQYENLSLRAKTILSRPAWLRTEEELIYIHRYTVRLHCFNRYPPYVRKELAKVLYYEKVEKDHYVIRQGNVGWFFYFIVSGSCLVEMKDMCFKSGKMVSMIAGEIKAGGTFGELALMHSKVRRASIVTNEDCEFLKVDKPSFDEVLRKSHENEWNNRLKHLSKHPLFQQWKEVNLNTAVEGSQTKEYLPDTVIVKDMSIPSPSIYFIIQGCCKVVQKVKLWEKVQSYHDDNFMFKNYDTYSTPRSSCPPSRRMSTVLRNRKLIGNRVYRLVTKWWIIRTLKEGEYFGLGEGDESMSLICDQKVVVLLVSKNVFRKHNRERDLAYLRAEAISWYPSCEEALSSFLEWKRWQQYKRNVVLGYRQERESTENYFLAE